MNFIKNNSYLLLVIILCFIFTAVGVNKMGHDAAYEKVTVATGDTLWGYSLEYGNNVPNDKWIQEVINLNNLSSTTIEVGKELRIPTRKAINRNDIATNLVGDEE